MTHLAEELTLETVLEIWQSTTARLEQTHLTLQSEVRRLSEELEEKNRQLAKKNRLADLGQMAGHVAHEVRNHLVPLTLYLSLLRRRLGLATGANPAASPPSVSSQVAETQMLVDKLESNIEAMRNMVQDLLNFTANRQPQRQRLDINALVAELITEIQEQCRAQKISLRQPFVRLSDVEADGEMVRSALRNLLLNAVDALGQGGAIEVRAEVAEDGWKIAVWDDGEGIPAEVRERIFDPFYTTKSTGTGLGLSVVERVMESHGGWVSLEPRQPSGTCACLHFPRLGRKTATGMVGAIEAQVASMTNDEVQGEHA